MYGITVGSIYKNESQLEFLYWSCNNNLLVQRGLKYLYNLSITNINTSEVISRLNLFNNIRSLKLVFDENNSIKYEEEKNIVELLENNNNLLLNLEILIIYSFKSVGTKIITIINKFINLVELDCWIEIEDLLNENW